MVVIFAAYALSQAYMNVQKIELTITDAHAFACILRSDWKHMAQVDNR